MPSNQLRAASEHEDPKRFANGTSCTMCGGASTGSRRGAAFLGPVGLWIALAHKSGEDLARAVHQYTGFPSWDA